MPQNDRIGSLWEKHSERGEFFTGSLNVDTLRDALANCTEDRLKIVAFKNTRKEQDSHPDWNILISRPREGGR